MGNVSLAKVIIALIPLQVLLCEPDFSCGFYHIAYQHFTAADPWFLLFLLHFSRCLSVTVDIQIPHWLFETNH